MAAVGAAWLAVALEQVLRAGAGAIAGAPARGFALLPDAGWTLATLQDLSGTGSFAFAFIVAGASAGVMLVTSVIGWLVLRLRTSGWLRGFALVFSFVGMIWIPLALIAAVIGTGGPAWALYERLGVPRAGRWPIAALSLVLLAVVAGTVSSRAIAGGRGWMRVDGVEFRRRLVRTIAGWPSVTAALALGIGAGWAQTPWLAAFVPIIPLAFQLRTK